MPPVVSSRRYGGSTVVAVDAVASSSVSCLQSKWPTVAAVAALKRDDWDEPV